MKKANLKIELKSDLCVGSGFSYGNTIDTDVIYNDAGIPYIPARRIKGCLREAGQMMRMENERLDTIFGVAKSSKSGSLSISNAYIDETYELSKAVMEDKDINPQKMLELFTSVKAQTAIDQVTGIAKGKSLHFTRVVNQHHPISKNNLIFNAEVTLMSDDEEDYAVFENCVKALRHMGTNRNRGLGNVKCCLEKVTEESIDNARSDGKTTEEKSTDDIVLEYTLRNTQPLMLSGNADDISNLYINGQTVIGALASAYLKTKGKTAESDEFYDLFLNGKTRYLNVYPTDESRKYMAPVPLFINRMKKTRTVVNTLNFNMSDKELNAYTGNGNKPKKIKNAFGCFDDKKIRIVKPQTEIVYHHSKSDKQSEENNQLLYTLEVIKENQLFTGRIITKPEYRNTIEDLLKNSRLYFGKSKSAQYGRCELAGKIEAVTESEFTAEEGDTVAVTLNSPAVFNINNHNATAFKEIKEQIKKDLNIITKKEPDYKDESMMQVEVITGYQGTWNLKRPSYQAISSGSTFIYKLGEDLRVDKTKQVGSKKQEGYGHISIYKINKGNYELMVQADETKLNINSEVIKPYKKLLKIKEFRSEWLKDVMNKKNPLNISSAALGRVMLMLKQSMEMCSDEKAVAQEWKKRINSIKTDSTRNAVNRFVDKYINNDNTFKADEVIQSIWPEMMLEALTYIKYTKKEKANDTEEKNS